MHQSRWDWLRKQRPNRAERPGVRRPSGALPRADEENQTDFLKLFLDDDGSGGNAEETAKDANHAKHIPHSV